jgi:hypothetical protein
LLKLAHFKGPRLMSALGHKRTFAVQKGMSALPPIADMCGAIANVCFVPKADIRLVGITITAIGILGEQ